MKMGMQAKVQNDPELAIKLDQAILKGLWGAILIIHGQVVLLCPVDTGRLAGSHTAAVWNKQTPVGTIAGRGASAIQKSLGETKRKKIKKAATQEDTIRKPVHKYTALEGTNVEYAPHVEFRENGTGAHMRPGFALSIRGALRYFWDAVRKFPFKGATLGEVLGRF